MFAHATPAQHGLYSGAIVRVVKARKTTSRTTFPIALTVSQGGGFVTRISLARGYPVYCQGGGFGTARSRSAQISSTGTFTAMLPIVFRPTQQPQGFVIVTGTFTPHVGVSGTVHTRFAKKLAACSGTATFTARR